jgi:NAD(P)-dependent dehydrogenase (short-subunit alcohol dehydrogenase family)
VTDDPFDGKTLLVIGGSSGIGAELARRAGARGARLIIAGRQPAKLEAMTGELGGSVQTLTVDAHDDEALAHALGGLPSLDHVVSMIGDSMSGGFLDTDLRTMRHVIFSKFWTNWLIGRAVAAKIRPGGTITFTSGTGGRPHEISATYVANLSLGALVQGLAVELAPQVRVNAIAPTFMGANTAFWRDVRAADLAAASTEFEQAVPLKRLATPDHVADAYVALMSNPFITGQTLAVDGGVMLTK